MSRKTQDKFASLRRINERELDSYAHLIDATKTLAISYATLAKSANDEHKSKHKEASITLIDALAHTYALAEMFNFHNSHGVADYDEAGCLLKRLDVEPDGYNGYENPIHALVKAMFGSQVHRSQPSRWAQVIAFLHPSDEDLERLDNANHQQWAELFKAKFAEYGGTVKSVLRARQKATAQPVATSDVRAITVAEYANTTQRFSILSVNAPVDSDMVVILRRIPSGSIEAIPLPLATTRLEVLIQQEALGKECS